MVYFINCYVVTEMFISYRMYSEGSKEDLEKRFIEDFIREWHDYIDESSIDLNQEFSNVIGQIKDTLNSMMDDFDLEVYGPYTNTSYAFDFYDRYISDEEYNYADPYEFPLYLRGDYLNKHKNIFPYLADLHKKYRRLNISTDLISKLSYELKS